MLLVPFFFTLIFFLFFLFFTFYLFLDADYADDSAVLAYVLKDATFLLHSIERTAKEIGLYIDADKNRVHLLQSRCVRRDEESQW